MKGFYKASSQMVERPDLTDSEKIMIFVLDSLQQKNGYCYATNAALGELLSWEERKVRRCLSELVKWGFIECTYINNRDRHIKVLEGGQECPRGQERPRGQNLSKSGQKCPPKVVKIDQEGGQKRPPLYNRKDNRQLNRQLNKDARENAQGFFDVESEDLDKPNDHQPETQKEKVPSKRKRVEVVMPWESEAFTEAWELWKRYKKEEHRFGYKSAISEQAALKKLSQLANGWEDKAIEIIHNAIENGWKGLFATTEKQSNNGKRQPVTEDIYNNLMQWASDPNSSLD